MANSKNRVAYCATLAALALAMAGCGEATGTILGDPPAVTVALVDASASVAPEDREIHLQSLRAIADGLEGGDRVLVGPVTAQASWRPSFDATVEQSNVRLDQEEAIATVRSNLEGVLPELMSGRAMAASANETRLLEAIVAASQAFGSPPFRNAELVLLSDGVEESPTADLSGITIAPDEIDAALDRAEGAGLLPDLTGLQLTLAGAGGRDYGSVQAFWKAWCERTGATLQSYGRLPYRARN